MCWLRGRCGTRWVRSCRSLCYNSGIESGEHCYRDRVFMDKIFSLRVRLGYWDTYLESSQPNGVMQHDGVIAEGWDAWAGGSSSATIPRAHDYTEEKLLGQRGCIRDRHSTAQADVLSKLRALRVILQICRSTWDEVFMIMQLVARGQLGYAPLVGIPSAPLLHQEDDAFQRLLLCAMRTRWSVERMGLFSSRKEGG